MYENAKALIKYATDTCKIIFASLLFLKCVVIYSINSHHIIKTYDAPVNRIYMQETTFCNN